MVPSAKAMGIKSLNYQFLMNGYFVRLNQTTILATEGLDKFDAFTASDQIDKFVDDLSLWYIRRSRSRVGPAAKSKRTRTHSTILHTIYYILLPCYLPLLHLFCQM